jgi:signal peptidase I
MLVLSARMPSSSMYPTLQIGDAVVFNKLSRSPSRGDIIAFAQPCEPARMYIKRVVAVGGDTVEVRCNVVFVNGVASKSEVVAENEIYEDYDDMAIPEPKWYRKEVSRYRETIDGTTIEVFHDALRPERDRKRNEGAVVYGDAKDFPLDNLIRSCSLNNIELDAKPSANQKPGKIVATREDAPVCEPHLHYIVPEDHYFVLGDNRANSNDSRYWGSVPAGNVRGKLVGIAAPFGRMGGVR